MIIKLLMWTPIVLASIFLSACISSEPSESIPGKTDDKAIVDTVDFPKLMVLGTIQDAGSPQIDCEKACCKGLFENPDPNRMVVSLGVSCSNGEAYLFEATPDLPRQLNLLQKLGNGTNSVPNGIFITHAHIGHYTGLMYLGKEATDARNVPVYAMPRMTHFLENNGPWNLLIERQNIAIHPLEDEKTIDFDEVSVTPILVPHRDEYSETVGFRITGPNRSALFIPDIDKWTKWEQDIKKEIAQVDLAFLDATFFSGVEMNNRDISQIPHPFVIESLKAFKDLESEEKQKIYFIHFNHTNPLIDSESQEAKQVLKAGFNIAQFEDTFGL